jgi:hypothetical protein
MLGGSRSETPAPIEDAPEQHPVEFERVEQGEQAEAKVPTEASRSSGPKARCPRGPAAIEAELRGGMAIRARGVRAVAPAGRAGNERLTMAVFT